MKRLAYTSSHLSSIEAEWAREDVLDIYRNDIRTGRLLITEDMIKFINNHYVFRLMLESPQLEMELEVE